MDEDRLLKRRYSKSLEKLDKAGLNLNQKYNSKLLCFLFTCKDFVWQITNFTLVSSVYVWERYVSYCESSSILSWFYPRLTLHEKMDQINKLKDHINVCMMTAFHPVLNYHQK